MTIKHIVQVLCAIVITSFLLGKITHILKRKDSDIKYQVFYEQSEKFDVLFYGPSVIHYTIYPMQLWNDYGIASYNMANDSERLAMSYYHILNSLDYANPRLVVVDLTGMAWAGSLRDNTAKDHNFLDSLPLSKNKILEIINIFNKEDRLEFLFPLYTYHYRWEFLEENDFSYDRNVYYGANFLSGVCAMKKPTPEDYEASRYGDVGAESIHILNIVKLCRKHDIKVLFIYYPSPARGGDQKLREYCKNLLIENEIDYLDLLYLDIVDWDNDFIQDGHMNYYGGEKVTNYLGNYIVANYDIPDRRKDFNYSSWKGDYEEYENIVEKYKAANIILK